MSTKTENMSLLDKKNIAPVIDYEALSNECRFAMMEHVERYESNGVDSYIYLKNGDIINGYKNLYLGFISKNGKDLTQAQKDYYEQIYMSHLDALEFYNNSVFREKLLNNKNKVDLKFITVNGDEYIRHGVPNDEETYKEEERIFNEYNDELKKKIPNKHIKNDYNSYTIKITDLNDDNKVIEFWTLREAAKFLGVTCIYVLYSNDKILKGRYKILVKNFKFRKPELINSSFNRPTKGVNGLEVKPRASIKDVFLIKKDKAGREYAESVIKVHRDLIHPVTYKCAGYNIDKVVDKHIKKRTELLMDIDNMGGYWSDWF